MRESTSLSSVRSNRRWETQMLTLVRHDSLTTLINRQCRSMKLWTQSGLRTSQWLTKSCNLVGRQTRHPSPDLLKELVNRKTIKEKRIKRRKIAGHPCRCCATNSNLLNQNHHLSRLIESRGCMPCCRRRVKERLGLQKNRSNSSMNISRWTRTSKNSSWRSVMNLVNCKAVL